MASTRRTRDPAQCERFFEETLRGLHVDRAGVANVHYVGNMAVWGEVVKKGVVAFAVRLQEEGKAEVVGVSTHSSEVIHATVESGAVDVITYQVNHANHRMPGRDEALQLYAEKGVGVVAMKPFAGGCLLKPGKRVKVPGYKRGGESLEIEVPEDITPERCLRYSLAQPGVSTVIAGFSNTREVEEALTGFNRDGR
jgi:predicted aldo/keto reductase-like oxidoreductase